MAASEEIDDGPALIAFWMGSVVGRVVDATGSVTAGAAGSLDGAEPPHASVNVPIAKTAIRALRKRCFMIVILW